MKNIVNQYFVEHPQSKDEVMKAYYAYHIPHYRLNPKSHNFLNGSRYSACVWCHRTREQVRWDDLPPECDSIPDDAHSLIEDVILKEEQQYVRLSNRSESIIKKILKERKMSGSTLAFIKQTYGILPEDVCDILDIDYEVSLRKDFEMEEEKHSNLGKTSFKPEIVNI